MYVLYEDHIEYLEEENKNLKRKVTSLKQRLEYFKSTRFKLKDFNNNE
jgi:cell division septum initiation protein DivIVA